MKPHSPLESVLAHVRAEPLRTWSIIITFFGDAIVPRGGQARLAMLLSFFKGMEVGETVVRSAVSRLTAEDWLIRTRVGRNSFYHLAERGHETFLNAAQLIYNQHRPDWSGAFETILAAPTAREALGEVLGPAGFGTPLPGLFVAPGGRVFPALGAGALRLTVSGEPETLRELAARAWKLTTLAGFYQRFIEAFSPLHRALRQGEPLTALESILARVLLIHEYRRIALRDPLLPAEILPAAWPGDEARALCAAIYARLLAASEAWLDENALDEAGCPLPADPGIYSRFISSDSLPEMVV